MIEDFVKIHDKFSVEFKIDFSAQAKQDIHNFFMNMWIFIPNSLDINRYTYSQTDFYKDVKSNIRLITPIYLLREIANPENMPLRLLTESFRKIAANPVQVNIDDYETQIKMFQSILKSAIRDEIHHILTCESSEDRIFLIRNFTETISKIKLEYRSLKEIIHVPTVEREYYDYFLFGDEFMSDLIELQTFKLLDGLARMKDKNYNENKVPLLKLIEEEIHYKKERGYLLVEKYSKNKNRMAISRFGTLKKYMESQLFLSTQKQEDGIVAKQFYYSLAAGISMIFATIIAFSFQLKYGNFTLPLFIALVVGYMMKDRIKDLSKDYFNHKLNSKYFDSKTEIRFNNFLIGEYKERQGFINEHQAPEAIRQLRNRSSILEAENRINDEKIILYQTQMKLDKKSIDSSNVYPIAGVNNIIRFNLSQFIRKMDNPQVPIFITDENSDYAIIEGEKLYYLNFLLSFQYNNQSEYKRYRIAFNREGIKDLEEISN